MPPTSRELVRQCLAFEGPARIPRELWTLPWSEEHHGDEVDELRERFPNDIDVAPAPCGPGPRVRGDKYAVGTYVDEWGCIFENLQRGVIGEVRAPVVPDLDAWRDRVKPPYEVLPDDPDAARDTVNRACAGSDRYVLAAPWARPWERYQFLRGSENAMFDVMDPDAGARDLLRTIHEYYLKEMEFWVATDVDGVRVMDDWGAQGALLIPPPVFRDLFKPLYRDYCDLAHAHGKTVWLHSDGHITEILPDFIEVGVDALNSQLFCMDLADLARLGKGRIAWWGEIDRQHVLPSDDPQAGRDAVREVAAHLYDPAGGVIAQLELSPGANPGVAAAAFDEWNRIGSAE